MQGAQLRKHIDATLGSGNLREAVKLPTGEDLNEWLAVNSNSFYLSLSCMHVCTYIFRICSLFNVCELLPPFNACQSVRFSIVMCYSAVLANLCSVLYLVNA